MPGIIDSSRYRGKYVSPNQYESELNVAAHYTTTGLEIWQQTRGAIDYFFAGFGTCGTITGVGRFLKEHNPDVRIVGVEPASREHRLPGMKRISDLPEDLVPKIPDRSVIDDSIEVGDDQAYEMGVRLARTDGILVGLTTGAILAAAMGYAENHRGIAVVISPDSALKYVSWHGEYLEAQGEGP